jgi:ABC-type sugar transport system substrate-binding protein
MKHRWARRISVVCLVLLVIALVPASLAAQAKSGKKLTIALVTKALNNPFWGYMKEEFEKVCAANGVESIYLAPTKANNLEEQTRLVEDLIQRKVDGIVLVPVDSDGIVPVIKRANAAGVPISLANSKAFGGQVVTLSAIENYDAMTLLAEFMVSKLNGKGKIIILEGPAGAQTNTDRLRAVRDVLKKYPGITVLASQTADFQRAKGLQVMENLSQTYMQFDAILSMNDEMALGAIEALDAAKRLGNVLISGFDASDPALKAVWDGQLVVTMDQNPRKQAGDAAQALIDFINGKKVPERIVTPGILVTKENISLYESRIKK